MTEPKENLELSQEELISTNKRHGDKMAKNTNLTIKIIGTLLVIIMSLIGFGVNISVDIAKQVGIDIRVIRDTVSIIQQDNKLNSQAITENKEDIEHHEIFDNTRFLDITDQLRKLQETRRLQ